ncbi:integrase [Streptomyces erythrochromogenes]|uniref:integrase n=1 Tax=Streptomyces erythrochromogenes TaxID=285574 RepID=UPI003444A5FD
MAEPRAGRVGGRAARDPRHIGVTAGVYAHERLRLQRQAIDTLDDALRPTGGEPDDPSAAAVLR